MRHHSQNQKTLFSPEELSRRAWRIKAEIVAAAKLPPSLKAVIAALWEFHGQNRFCWPSQQTLAHRLCYSWPASRRALQDKLYQLEERRLIVIEPAERHDGSTTSNKYRILWGNLKRTEAATETKQRRSTVAKTSAPPRLSERPPASEQAPPRARTDAPPRLPERPLNTNGSSHLNRTTTPTNAATGVGGFGNTGKNPTAPQSGKWAGFIDIKFPPPEVLRLYRAAVEAGLMEKTPIDQVRIVAAALQAVTRPKGMESGWFVSMVQRGDWNYLSPVHVQDAIGKLAKNNITLTPDELPQIRLPRGMQP